MIKSIIKGKQQHKSFYTKLAYCYCTFKRNKTSKWEKGLAISKCENIGISDIETIIDIDNKIVESVYTYELVPNKFEMKDGYYII